MQDIPRNELLDKLVAGWKVRRSVWPKEQTISINGGSMPMSFTGLIADGWEGEPPQPLIRFINCSIYFAFSELQRSDTKYIRRPSWDKKGKCTFDHEKSQVLHVYELRLEDILAGDWEVWA